MKGFSDGLLSVGYNSATIEVKPPVCTGIYCMMNAL